MRNRALHGMLFGVSTNKLDLLSPSEPLRELGLSLFTQLELARSQLFLQQAKSTGEVPDSSLRHGWLIFGCCRAH